MFLSSLSRNVRKSVSILFEVAKTSLWYAVRGEYGTRAHVVALTESLVRENLLFIKIFQYLSSFTEDFSLVYIDVFRTYTNQAAFQQCDVDFARLDDIVSRYQIQLCNHGKPVNSASIAVVFKGHFIGSGDPVIIKLKKRNIDRILSESCSHVRFMFDCAKTYALPCAHAILRARSTFLCAVGGGEQAVAGNPASKQQQQQQQQQQLTDRSIVDLLCPFVDNLDNLLRQCDFRREIDAMKIAREESREIEEYVTIPRCFNYDGGDSDDASIDFIVMEFMTGRTFPQLVEEKVDETERLHYAKAVLVYFFFAGNFGTRVHVDLHFGNLFFCREQKKLQVIDFGMVEEITDEVRRPVYQLFKLAHKSFLLDNEPSSIAQQRESADMVSIMSDCFVHDIDMQSICRKKRDDLNRMLYDLIIVDMLVSGQADEFKLYEAMNSINATFGTHMQMKKEYYNLILGVAMMTKGLHNLADFKKEKYGAIVKHAVMFVLGCGDEEEEEEEEEDEE